MMKRLSLIAAALVLSGAAPLPHADSSATFDWFSYQGRDGAPTVSAGYYRNPVLSGFYSDPSIVRVGDMFYLTTSTFSWFPGIPVFASPDLVHWRQIGNAIDRPDQLSFTGLGMSRGVFAPAIAHHGDRFYIADVCIDCGGTFILTARDPAGPWSNPIWLKSVDGIDPSLFFDDDGSVWMINNREPVGGSTYDGHRALWLQRLDATTLQPAGPAKMIVNGGVDLATKPVWIEGPHLFRYGGFYYISAAEGGTSVNHSQVIFRAPTLDGPFRPAPGALNPILTQRDLPADRPSPVSAAGHADMVELPDGRWWAVFLATQPYRADFYNTGRETWLLPVTWHDGWPTILAHGLPIPRIAKAPPLPPPSPLPPPMTGPFTARDDFNEPRLVRYWMMMRTPHDQWWRLGGGSLSLRPRSVAIGDHGQPSLIARRQQHMDADASTELRFDPREGEEAGLVALQDDDHFLTIALSRDHGHLSVRAAQRTGPADPTTGITIARAAVPDSARRPLWLKISARKGRYALSYATAPGKWQMLAPPVDGTILSTATAGGFTGALIGMYATARSPSD